MQQTMRRTSRHLVFLLEHEFANKALTDGALYIYIYTTLLMVSGVYVLDA